MSSTRFSPRRRALRPRATAALAVIAVVVAGLFWQASTATALTSVTSNYSYGDFEGTTLAPAGWTLSATSPARVYASGTVALSGKRSLCVDDPSATAGASALRSVRTVTPGVEYQAQGYAYTYNGTQTLALRFYDAAGAVISRVASPSTGATMLWSRIAVKAVAPPKASRVVVEISSTPASVSRVWWDAVEVIQPGVTNNGFESVSSTAAVPSWTTSAAAGTSAKVRTGYAKLGTKSLFLSDASTSGLVKATSARTPVFAGVAHDLRAWVRPTSGTFTVTVRFLDTNLAVVKTVPIAVSKPAGTWSLVAKQLVVPTTGHWATVELSTGSSTKASGDFDVVDLRPTVGSSTLGFTQGRTMQPVDAFANTNVVRTAVVAGRAKLMGVVSGSPAELQVVDIESNTVEERFTLGSMESVWAMATTDNAVYVGGNDGHLWRWTYGDAAISDLGRATASSATVFDLEEGPDGRIWGASYPKSELWSYQPGTGTFSNLGTVSAAHDYARSLAVNSSYAYVGLGSTNPVIVRVSLSNPASKTTIAVPQPVTSGQVSEVDLLGRYLSVKTPSGTSSGGTVIASERRLYDTQSGSWSVDANYPVQRPSPVDGTGNFYFLRYNQLRAVNSATGATDDRGGVTMGAGRDRMVLRATLSGDAGGWLLAYDPAGTVTALETTTLQQRTYRVEFAPTKLKIKSLGFGSGRLMVGGFGGSSLAMVDLDLSQRSQYPAVPYGAAVIGEVEGSVEHGKYQYIGTYTDGRVFRYDSTQPWVDGTNPALVTTLGPTYRQDRPIAWATSGTRTFFGTIPKYGVLGGVLGIFDGDSGTPRIVSEPVADQSIVSLAAAGDVVYGGTSRWGGLGATPTQSSAKVFAYNAATGKLLWQVTPAAGMEAYGAVVMGPTGTLWAAGSTTLYELDPATGATLRSIMIQTQQAQATPVFRNTALASVNGLIYLVAAGRAYAVDPATLRVSTPVASGITPAALVVRGNQLFVPQGETLQEVVIQ
ncbi:hypothetical protein [Pedococcus soli]